MNARRKITVLAAAGAAALAAGIPALYLSDQASTEIVSGAVVQVDGGDRTVLVRDTGGPAALRGSDVLIHLAARQRVELARGSEPLSSLRAGRLVRARVNIRTGRAEWIELAG